MEPINNSAIPDSQVNPNLLKPKISLRLVVVIIVTVALIVGIAIFFIQNKKNPTSTTIEQQTSLAVTPSAAPTVQTPATATSEPIIVTHELSWYIQLVDDPQMTDLYYYINPSPPNTNTLPLVVGSRPPSISGTVFTSLKSSDFYCTFFKDERIG